MPSYAELDMLPGYFEGWHPEEEEEPEGRPCPGPWTGFMDGSAPLCSCHAVPDAWLDEAYPTYDIEPGTPCGSVRCPCVFAPEED